MSTGKDPVASPARIASQDGELGDLVRAAIRYTPALDQASAFRSLLERKRGGARSRRAPVALSVAFACLALVAVVAFWFKARGSGAQVAVDTNAAVRTAPRSSSLAVGDTRLEDGTVVRLAARSSARVESTVAGSRIALDSGKVTLEVTPQRAGRTLEVRSGRYRFVVLGTEFTVSSLPERVAASVREGRVAVFRDETRLAELGAGETWSSDAAVATDPSLPTAPPPSATPPAAVPRPSTEPDAHGATEPPTTANDRDCLALARDGRAREAERCFVDQAADGGLRAELALSEIARLRSDVLGDPKGALYALEQYRSRFPTGSLRTEVDLSYVHLLARVGRSRDVIAETDRLLASGSAREREGELRMLRGNTLRAGLKDFAAAEREYAAAERGGSKFAGEATYYRGVCFEALGDTAQAIEAFRRYLSVPGRPHEAEAQRRVTAQ